jgi:hypothetical protein
VSLIVFACLAEPSNLFQYTLPNGTYSLFSPDVLTYWAIEIWEEHNTTFGSDPPEDGLPREERGVLRWRTTSRRGVLVEETEPDEESHHEAPEEDLYRERSQASLENQNTTSLEMSGPSLRRESDGLSGKEPRRPVRRTDAMPRERGATLGGPHRDGGGGAASDANG